MSLLSGDVAAGPPTPELFVRPRVTIHKPVRSELRPKPPAASVRRQHRSQDSRRRGLWPRFLPFFKTGTGHAFAQAAFIDEGLFQTAELLVEQIVGLVDQADDRIGRDFRVGRVSIYVA